MTSQTQLKALLVQRHWQTYRTFCIEYDRAAKTIDHSLVGTYPSRAQYHRWLSGEVRTSPYPDACRVLEHMFPGRQAGELFLRADGSIPPVEPTSALSSNDGSGGLVSTISQGLQSPNSEAVDWQPSAPSIAPLQPQPLFSAHGLGDSLADEIGRRLVALSRLRRLSPRESEQLAALAGSLVDLSLSIAIDIQPDGATKVTYSQEVLNLTDRPLTRIARDLWFEHTIGRLDIQPVQTPGRRLGIQRTHDTPSSSQFALQFSPPVGPGETATASWTCEGVQFVSDHYWRQSLPRHTRHLTIEIRQRNAKSVASCSAVKGHPDGSDNSIEQDLMWDHDDDDVLLTLTHDYLRPGQSVTVRWEVTNGPATR